MKKSTALRSPRQLRIALCPDKVAVAYIERGWRARIAGKQVVDVETASDQPWRAPLAALENILAEIKGPQIAATVILSNHFVRYAVVPWNDGVDSAAEQTAFARHCFRNVYGDAEENWDIRVSDGGFRRNALAAAVDRDLSGGLVRLFAARAVPLLSLQPHFMAACNRFHRELASHERGCFAVLERGRAAIGIYDAAGWRTLTARRVGAPDAVALAPVIAQEALSAPEAPRRLWVAAVEYPQLELTIAGWTVRPLRLKAQRGFSPFDDPGCAMALCGVA